MKAKQTSSAKSTKSNNRIKVESNNSYFRQVKQAAAVTQSRYLELIFGNRLDLLGLSLPPPRTATLSSRLMLGKRTVKD